MTGMPPSQGTAYYTTKDLTGLTKHLYKSIVTSDRGGTNSTAESVKAGCNIEFPFSTNWWFEKLLTAREQGKVSQQGIDRAAENALTLVQWVEGDAMSAEEEEREDDDRLELVLQRWRRGGHRDGAGLRERRDITAAAAAGRAREGVFGSWRDQAPAHRGWRVRWGLLWHVDVAMGAHGLF
ncbi:hypothetical protein MAPG_07153 [Magnaporthiopsis poae ATCC 64411]|uniref:Uncharacterized protein n=1 Tax=Magnaporthiopsis poae (strain ATCC 64411 / 73-15) TaxID=644358 RepID=A0A0C4E3X6_MAGP6|nr:hypothetical protein MAPG_07153 [Magnaporthiopsis poae ATCC 64411]